MTLAEFIMSQLKERDMSMRRFAQFIGVSSTTISNALNPNKNIMPGTDFLTKLADATNTDIGVIVSMAFPELTSLDTATMLLAIQIKELPEAQQATIRQLMKGMLMEHRRDEDKNNGSLKKS